MLFQFYALTLAAALLTAGLFVLAGQSAGLARDYGPLPVGHGVSVPPHTEVAGAPPWWALIFTLVADGTLFASPCVRDVLSLDRRAELAGGGPHPRRTSSSPWRPSWSLLSPTGSGTQIDAGARPSADQRAAGSALAMLALLAAIAACVASSAASPHRTREHALGATADALLFYVAVHAGNRHSFPRQQSPAARRRPGLAAALDATCA